MNDHNNASSGTSPDVPPPLPSNQPDAGSLASSRNPQPPAPPQPVMQSSDEPLPAGVKGWCWGAFLLNWIWAIRFRVWWGLLALIPLVGLAVTVWLGIKGRELAWRQGNWTSVQAFNDAQRKWSIGGAVIAVVACLVYGGSFAYERWQAHRTEATTQGTGMTPEQMAAIISAPVTVPTVPASEPVARQPEPYSILPDPAPNTIAVPVLGRSGPFNVYAVEPKDDLDALKYFSGHTVYQPQELAKLLPVIEEAAAKHYGLTCEYLCADAQGNIVGRIRIHTDGNSSR